MVLSDSIWTIFWSCWANVEIMEDRWCILMLFKTMFWKLELLRKLEIMEDKWCILTLFKTMFWKLELLRKFGIMDDRWCFRGYLKRCFGSFSCLEILKSTDAKLFILALFEKMFFQSVFNGYQMDKLVHRIILPL